MVFGKFGIFPDFLMKKSLTKQLSNNFTLIQVFIYVTLQTQQGGMFHNLLGLSLREFQSVNRRLINLSCLETKRFHAATRFRRGHCDHSQPKNKTTKKFSFLLLLLTQNYFCAAVYSFVHQAGYSLPISCLIYDLNMNNVMNIELH